MHFFSKKRKKQFSHFDQDGLFNHTLNFTVQLLIAFKTNLQRFAVENETEKFMKITNIRVNERHTNHEFVNKKKFCHLDCLKTFGQSKYS